MKKTVQFGLYAAEYPGEERETNTNISPIIFRELMSRWPKCTMEGLVGFQVDLDVNSATLKDILDFLRVRLGKIPKWTRFPVHTGDLKTIYLTGNRIFEPQEIEEAPYCMLFPEWPIAKGNFNDDDTLVIATKSIKKKPLGYLAAVCFDGPYCTGALKQLMEAEAFFHLQFRPMAIQGNKPPADGIWQLWSDARMPAMLNRIVDNKGMDYKPEANNGCTIDELYIPFQFRYKKAEVEQMGDFDVALTREYFGNHRSVRNQPKLIVSKRFRKWCDAQKLQILWTPIALEESGSLRSGLNP